MLLLVSIESNIGCGKSTLLEELRNATFCVPHIVVQEDVKEWTSFVDSEGNNILQKYYQDQTKFGYCFQSLVLMTRIHSIHEAMKKLGDQDGIIILERSHLTDSNIFAKMLYEKGAMSEIEWMTYNKCQTLVADMLHLSIDLFIYLKASPSTCLQRIAVRHRKGEDLIPFKYLHDLHEKHEQWLSSASPVFTVENEADMTNGDARQALLRTIQSRIEVAFRSKIDP